jgi:hypothetical protein
MKRILTDDSGIAIICEHIAIEKMPILKAKKDKAIDPEDSGWQFLCNSGKDEDTSRAKIWSIREVIEYDPTLAGCLAQPDGTELTRANIYTNWEIFMNKSK